MVETQRTPWYENMDFTHLKLEFLVALMTSSGFRFQFFKFPFTKPEMITNTSTTTLIQVNTLFTMADSFTPNASSPACREKYTNTYRMKDHNTKLGKYH